MKYTIHLHEARVKYGIQFLVRPSKKFCWSSVAWFIDSSNLLIQQFVRRAKVIQSWTKIDKLIQVYALAFRKENGQSSWGSRFCSFFMTLFLNDQYSGFFIEVGLFCFKRINQILTINFKFIVFTKQEVWNLSKKVCKCWIILDMFRFVFWTNHLSLVHTFKIFNFIGWENMFDVSRTTYQNHLI